MPITRTRINAPLLLALVTVFLYLNSWGGPFVIDRAFLIPASQIDGWEGWKAIWTTPVFYLPQAGIAQYYRPLLISTFRIEYLSFGEDTFGYHLVNTGLHFLNGWLVYLICLRLFKRSKTALLAALLFLVHPLQTEEVVNIGGLSGLASVATMLAAICLYLKSRREGRVVFYLFSLVFFLVGVLYKESSLILPFLICWIQLADWVRPGSTGKRKFLKTLPYLAGYFLCLGVYLNLRFFILLQEGILPGDRALLGWGLLTSIKGLGVYLKLILFPLHLHYFRSLLLATDGWRLFPLSIVISGAAILFVKSAVEKKLPVWLFVGSGWFLIGLLPACGLKPLFLQRDYFWWAERFLYFPLIGFGIAAAGLVERLVDRLSPRRVKVAVLYGCLGGIFLGYSLLTLRQNGFWSSGLRFYQRAAGSEPQIFRAREHLGTEYLKRGEAGKAVEEFKAAREILHEHSGREAEIDYSPFDKFHLKILLVKLAPAYRELNRPAEVRETAEELIRIFPNDFEGYFFLGSYYLEEDKAGEALPLLREAYRLNDGHFGTAAALIACYRSLGEPEKADGVWREAARKIPAFRDALQEMEGK